MSTISIKNLVEPAMDELIESRIYFMLGSSLTSLKTLEAVIEPAAEHGERGPLVRCDIRALERHGRWHLVSNHQYGVTHALEGALTRLKRSLKRQRQQRQLA